MSFDHYRNLWLYAVILHYINNINGIDSDVITNHNIKVGLKEMGTSTVEIFLHMPAE